MLCVVLRLCYVQFVRPRYAVHVSDSVMYSFERVLRAVFLQMLFCACVRLCSMFLVRVTWNCFANVTLCMV